VLRTLGGRSLLFDEQQQAIYELNGPASDAWGTPDTGLGRELVEREFSHARGDLTAARAVMSSPSELASEGSDAALNPATGPGGIPRLQLLPIAIAGVAVHLYFPPALLDDVRAVLGHLICDPGEIDVLLCAYLAGDVVEFRSPGRAPWSCPRAAFVPLLKAQLIEDVLLNARYEVALHAAALVRRDRTVLLVGSPGAGKTTLAVGMMHAGFELLADDVVLLDDKGSVTGLPFPPAAKAGSWPLIARHFPKIAIGPPHRRPDGRRVRFVVPDRIAAARPRRIGTVVLLDRSERAEACVRDIDPVLALGALLAEGTARDCRLGAAGFAALVGALDQARCCRLTYQDLPAASDVMRDLCS
jgi:hypothetical protein